MRCEESTELILLLIEISIRRQNGDVLKINEFTDSPIRSEQFLLIHFEEISRHLTKQMQREAIECYVWKECCELFFE